jgi:hypothetical protein
MERASFDPMDPSALVEASLACPFCLHAVDWESAGHGAEPAVACRCRGCGHTRDVALSGEQLLRLATLDYGELIAARYPSPVGWGSYGAR